LAEQNALANAGKQSRHLNIRNFKHFLSSLNLFWNKHIRVQYCGSVPPLMKLWLITVQATDWWMQIHAILREDYYENLPT
jgi:hypothetical protein